MKVVPILKKENDTACLTAFQESTIVCGFLTHALDDTVDLFKEGALLDLFDNCKGTQPRTTIWVKGAPQNSTTYIHIYNSLPKTGKFYVNLSR